jgi:ribonuclease P protein component
MLSSTYRFHGHGSLKYLYKNGDAVRTRLFVVKVVANRRRPTSRLAVVVGKKVLKSAVGRNRIRRRVYEVLRRNIYHIDQLYDVVIIVTSAEVVSVDSNELTQLLTEALVRAGVYKTDQ